MINQNNPFYGNYCLNGSAGTGYMSTGSTQIPVNQPNQFFNQPNRFQSIHGRLVNNLDEITPQEVPMDEKSRRHVHEALDTFKDIWKDADPAMRKELKASMQQAINEMPA